ncbi:MAG TPA: endonuclease/exonuclease/phosphatase family protein, partial [Pseudomonadales bacterium]|nr:endonuclease/exonuclease/phosphatase family protein [Pseudomonadales bacterium]
HKRDHVVPPERFNRKLQQLARFISEVLLCPDVLAVQEVENIQTLQRLGDATCVSSGAYRAVLVEGNDFVGMDVGFLVKRSLNISSVQSLASKEKMPRGRGFLFDHPPLLLQLTGPNQSKLSLLAVHNRSFKGLENPQKRRFVEYKRQQQAQWLGNWVAMQLKNRPAEHLIVLGDFNADYESDSLRLISNASAAQSEQRLWDVAERISADQRYSYVYRHKKQALDHVLLSSALVPAVREAHYSPLKSRSSKKAGARKGVVNPSDHAAMSVTLDMRALR